MNIYLVEDVGNSPGTIYACFASEPDADMFATALRQTGVKCDVERRTLFYGQPPVQAYNP